MGPVVVISSGDSAFISARRAALTRTLERASIQLRAASLGGVAPSVGSLEVA